MAGATMPKAGPGSSRKGCTGCLVIIILFFVIGGIYASVTMKPSGDGSATGTQSAAPSSHASATPANTQ